VTPGRTGLDYEHDKEAYTMKAISGAMKMIAAFGAVSALAGSGVAALIDPAYATWLAVLAVFFVLAIREL
jgi:hypothetical protein